MFGLSGLRLFGAGASAVALAFLLFQAWTGMQAKSALKDLRGDVAACALAAEKQAESAERCTDPVKASILSARAARQCDIALLAANRNATSFAIQSACSTAVKAEVAHRMTAEAAATAAEIEIEKLIADQAKIADRAEARGRAEEQRKDAANAAIKSAPPAAGISGKRCDAGCLLRLTGKA